MPDPKPVDPAADFPHEVAKDAPVALPEPPPGDPGVASRVVVADSMAPDNVLSLTLEREVAPGVWFRDGSVTGAPGQSQLESSMWLQKGGNYQWVAGGKQPATGTLVDPPPPKEPPPPKLASVEGAESVDPVEAEKG